MVQSSPVEGEIESCGELYKPLDEPRNKRQNYNCKLMNLWVTGYKIECQVGSMETTAEIFITSIILILKTILKSS